MGGGVFSPGRGEPPPRVTMIVTVSYRGQGREGCPGPVGFCWEQGEQRPGLHSAILSSAHSARADFPLVQLQRDLTAARRTTD